ncbi:DUF4440 domain-containing protein [Nostocales cyanobacterium HT-58-2]|nr:DUF4440 domain-containing protein [Nostocales cyanobacterium HT-58-2]
MAKLSRLLILGIILLCITVSTPPVFANSSMNKEDIRTLIEQARYAWVTQDADALIQLFTLDGELIVPGKRWQGREKIREEVTQFAQQSSDVTIEIQRIIIEGNQTVVEWYYEDTEKASGHRNKADDVIVVDFKEGQIIRWREYIDTKTPNRN